MKAHDPNLGDVWRNLRLGNSLHDSGKQFARRLDILHQSPHQNPQFARTGEFRTQPSIDKIRHFAVGAQELKLVFDRAKTLQGAFKKTLTDPDLQAQAKERKLDIDPVGGEELEALAREVMAQPADVVERMKRLLDK